jgi:hypothetical protein
MRPNGSELLYEHASAEEGSRKLHVPGVGLVEIISNESGIKEVVTNEVLAPEQQWLLDQWLEHEWTKRTS